MGSVKQEALADIKVIRETMENAKPKEDAWQRIFLIYGIANLFLYVFSMISNLFMSQESSHGIEYAVRWMVYLAVAVLILGIYRQNKVSMNQYYCSFLGVYVGAMVFVPMIFFAVRILNTILPENVIMNNIEKNNYMALFADLEMFLAIFLFSVSLIIVGYLSRKKIFFGYSLIHFFLYIIMLSMHRDVTVHLSGKSVAVSYYGLYCMIAVTIGYIWIGFYLRQKRK